MAPPFYLMTHSLLSSWLYLIKGNPYEDATSERDPMAEFMATLRREPTETTKAMEQGITFENLVNAIIAGEQSFGYAEMYDDDSRNGGRCPAAISDSPWYDAALEVANMCRGGQPQYKARRLVTIGDMSFILYGRLDYLKAGTVIDIKFSKGYERGNYIDSTQHPMYMRLIPEATEFVYAISNGSNVWLERYRRDECRDIVPIISDFIEWLKGAGLLETYMEHWLAE